VSRSDRTHEKGAPAESAPAAGGDPQPGTVRDRLEAVSGPILERFDEPIAKVEDLTDRTLALFPVRVWRHFLARYGFLLTAGTIVAGSSRSSQAAPVPAI
jgi:membrane protein